MWFNNYHNVSVVGYTLQLDADLTPKMKSDIERADSKVTNIDKELDRLEMKGRQQRRTHENSRKEAALAIKEVERLEEEKQFVLEDIKERELAFFKGFYDQFISASQCERENLHVQESIKTRENELRKAKSELQGKEKQLENYREKRHTLKISIEEQVKELEVHGGKITELEKDKAKLLADLESERVKVRFNLFTNLIYMYTCTTLEVIRALCNFLNMAFLT